MQIGMIGLGRVDAYVVRGLVGAKHECVAFDRSPDPVRALEADDEVVFSKLAGLVRDVDGDYDDPARFQALRTELGSAHLPAHDLAISPEVELVVSHEGKPEEAGAREMLLGDARIGAEMVGAQKEIWLIRHGETAWSRSGRHTGRTDVPLTERGEREALALRPRLGDDRFSLVLSSPLIRAWETCRLAGYGDVAVRMDDLMEWDYGAYEGRTSAEIRAETPGWSLWTDGVLRGETSDQVAIRARRVIDGAAQATGDVALFAHGHVLRILAACWVGLSPRDGRLLALGTASISVLGWENGYRVIRTWNLLPGAP